MPLTGKNLQQAISLRWNYTMAQYSNYNPQNPDKFQVSKEDKSQMNFNIKEF